MSDKSDNFKRIAERRTADLVHSIKLIGNLSGPSYEFDPADVFTMFREIEEAMQIARARFEKTKIFREASASFFRSDTPAPITMIEGQPHAPIIVAAPLGETDAQETIRLQQTVIDNLQTRLDALTGAKAPAVR